MYETQQKQVDQLKSHCTRYQTQLEEQQEQLQQTKQWKSQLDQYQKELKQLQTRLTESEKQVEVCTEQRRRFQEKYHQETLRIQTVNDQLKQLQQQESQWKLQVDTLTEENQQLQQTYVPRSELNQVRDRMTQLELENRAFQETKLALEQQQHATKKMQAECSQLLQVITTLKGKETEAEMAHKQLQQVSTQLRELTQQTEQQSTHIGSLTREKQQLEEKLGRYARVDLETHRSLKDVQSRMQALQVRYQTMKEEFTQLQTDRDGYKQQRDELQAHITYLTRKQSHSAHLQPQVETLQTKLMEAYHQIERLQASRMNAHSASVVSDSPNES
jgi:chromosome segregation ATPase